MAETTALKEMRLVETTDGWATALERDNTPVGFSMVVVMLMCLLGAGAIPLIGPAGIFLAMLLSIGVILALPAMVYRRIELKPHGLHLGWLYTRSDPAIEQIRSGEDSTFAWIPQQKQGLDLPFSEIETMGHTDYSVWFDKGEGRIEVMLPQTRRDDIARLHDEIQGVWKRYRAGLQDTEEEADARRARLANLQKES